MGRIMYVLPAVIALILLMGCSQQQPAPVQPPPSQPPVAPQPPPPLMNNTVPQGANASMNQTNLTVPNATSMNQTGAANNSMNQTAPPVNGTGNTTQTAPPPPPPQLPPAAAFSVDAND